MFKDVLFWAGLLLATAGLGFLAVSSQHMSAVSSFHRDGVTTRGVVVAKERRAISVAGGYDSFVTYRFETETGEEVVGRAGLARLEWNILREGGPVSVRYWPADPNFNSPGLTNTTFSPVTNFAAVIVFMVLPIIAGLIAMGVAFLRNRVPKDTWYED